MADQKLQVDIGVSDKASSPIAAFADRLGAIQSKVESIHLRMQGLVSGPMNALNAKMEKLSNGLQSLGIAGAVGFASLGGAAIMAVKGAADFASSIDDTVQRTGQTTEFVQTLRAMGIEAGVAGEDIEKGLVKIQIAMEKSMASGKLDDSFVKAGVSMQDLGKGAEHVMKTMANAFAVSKGDGKFDPTKLAVLTEIFGKAGVNFKEMMEQGGLSFDEARTKLQANGDLLSSNEITKLADFGDRIAALGNRFNIMKAQIGLALMPSFDRLIEKINTFLTVNKTGLLDRLESFTEKFDVAKSVTGIMKIAASMGTIIYLVDWVVDLFGGWGVLIYAMAGLKFWGMGVMIYGMVVAIVAKTAATWAWFASLAATQIVLAGISVTVGSLVAALLLPLAIITAIGIAVWAIWENFDVITAYIRGAWEKVKAAFGAGFFSGVWTLFKEAAFGAINAVLGLWNTTIGRFFEGARVNLVSDTTFKAQTVAERMGTSPISDNANIKLGQQFQAQDAAQRAASDGYTSRAAYAVPQANVGGLLRVEITGQGTARVQEIKSDGGMGIEVNTGMSFMGA